MVIAFARAVVVAGLALLGGTAVSAAATPADYVLLSPEATLTEGASPTTSYTLINLTDQPAILTSTTSEAGQHCQITPDPQVLPAHQQQQVVLTLHNCDLAAGKTVGISLKAGDTAFPVTAKPETAPHPVWGILQVFMWTPLVGLAAVVAGLLWFRGWPGPVPKAKSKVLFTAPLPQLGANWSLKDSWASNVTLVSAVFTGIFGTSDLLKSITGGEAPSAFAVITLASAIGLALIGVAPIVLQTLRNGESQVLVGGLLISAAIAVGASGGLVIAIARSVSSLVTGTAQVAVTVGAIIGCVLLLAYAATSVRQNLITGLTPPPKPKPTPAQTTAAVNALKKLIAGSLSDQEIRDLLPELQNVAPSYPPPIFGTSLGDGYKPSALI
ncbi:hypothetical protein [Kribbella kalugense]|uniref:Transmembrane protein n=1 Tax=Kribbella kalugense TaxID=2512221 RepID=A0A4V3G890_9ACTN|nr:hypothetical protein [Kribbella kalugense]TDW22004.1 hypothetical protein EV650_0835 [Kribbella kalugense]